MSESGTLSASSFSVLLSSCERICNLANCRTCLYLGSLSSPRLFASCAMTSIFGYTSAKRRFIAGFMFGCNALESSSNWARVITVLQVVGFAAALVLAPDVGESQTPLMVMTAAVAGTLAPESGLTVLLCSAACAGAVPALDEAFGV